MIYGTVAEQPASNVKANATLRQKKMARALPFDSFEQKRGLGPKHFFMATLPYSLEC
jgi:hypothetical protein